MVINTNIAAARSSRLLADSTEKLNKSLARLSSGSKIITPDDDAAGLAVSLRLDAQVSRINAAIKDVGAAASFELTQDGFLAKVGKALDRMSELAVLSQDVTITDADRALYDGEFQQLGAYITDIATKQFNGVDLFDGTALNVVIDSEGSTFAMSGVDLGAGAYTTATGSSVDTAANAATALTNVKAAIQLLTEDRAVVGANITRLNYTTEQLGVLKENLSAANSRIKDVNVAEEATQFARYNILVQSGTAMVAQANAVPQSVLKLLQ
jgi:flagellin